MTRWIPTTALVALIVLVTGCERRAAAPPSDSAAAADTISAPDTANAGDSAIAVWAREDSARANRARKDSVAAARAHAVRTAAAPEKAPEIIGRDSAFGPIGSIDSTGKLIPINPRRP